MSSQKKKSIIIVAFLTILLIALIAILVISKLPSKEAKITVENFDKYYNSKELKVIYYASSECGYCSLETPILESIAEDYDIDYLYVDSSKLSSEQRKLVTSKLDIEGATPTTVVVKNGRIIDTQVGYLDGTNYVEFFKNAGVVSEDAVYKDEQYLSFIDYSEYKELIDKGDIFVVVIGQTGCSHCIATKPVLNKIAGKYNIEINYIDITTLTEEDSSSLISGLKNLDYSDSEYLESGSIGTPLTLVIKNGKVVDYINGETTNSKFVKMFKSSGVIKE